jgi:nicotinic acid mononucleotide adenylyltransferase
LDERFAEIDSEKVRKEMKNNCHRNEKIPQKVEEVINDSQLPILLKKLFKFRLAE